MRRGGGGRGGAVVFVCTLVFYIYTFRAGFCLTHDDDTYEWTYVGAYARSESASSYLENKIRYLNRQKYDMFNENCQYYSKAVAEECIRDEDRGNLAVV